MKIFLLCTLLLLVSCAGFSGKPKEGKTVYSYNDVSGKFGYSREQKLLQNKLITRYQLTSSSKVLEKSITVSELGSIKQKNKRLMVLRPYGSEFTVWLEGKKFFSKMKLNPKTKAMDVRFEEDGEKNKGFESVPFPKGKYFCFFSQIPDCLYHNSLLTQARDNKGSFEFIVVWDSYPFTQDQYTNINKTLFSAGSLKYEGQEKNLFRFEVEVEGQIILYHFSKSFDLVKISWVSQGIVLLPPGEDISMLDDE